MKKSFFLFVISLFFIFIDMDAQKSFTNGFIITNSNDTVYCNLAYRSNQGKGDLCRTMINGVEADYNSFQIKGFGYGKNKFFMSGIVDSCFAELLLDGEIRLFRHNDIYIQKSGGKAYKLTSERRIVKNGPSKYFVDENRWRGVLISLLSDSGVDVEAINKMDFSEKNIQYLINRYNQGGKLADIELKDLPGKSKIGYGVLAGTNLQFLKTRYGNPDYRFLNDKYSSLHPAIGLNFTMTLPLISNKLSFQSEFYLTESSFSSLSIANKESLGLYYYNTSVKFTTISVPLSIRYLLNESDFQVYLEGGLLYNLNLDPESSVIAEKVIGGVVTTEETPWFKIIRNQFGLSGGVEVIKPLKHFSIGASLKYNHPYNFSSIPGFSTEINRISFSILFLR